MNPYQFFWDTMELCDWSAQGDDAAVLKPVIVALSKREDSDIFCFHDQMAELLYGLDSRALAEQCRKAEPYMSGDSFLYSRCVALINGPEYYEEAKKGKKKEIWNMEFESLIYIPERAWAKKHQAVCEDYPHIPPVSFETGSNKEGWK